jgi:hypothetical protein
MQRKEINERSPLRVLEQSIHGGLGRGNLGIVVARHGVGKTAFLVGLALDELMRGRRALHVSLEHRVDRVCDYYDEIFAELAHAWALEDVWRVRLDVERHRRIYSYLDGGFSMHKLADTLQFMRQHEDFVPDAIVLDGLDFARLGDEDLAALRAIARSTDAEVWMSAVTTRQSQRNERGVPEPVAHLEGAVDVILTMAHDGSAVHVALRKDHDNPRVSDLRLALDPRTMLLVREEGGGGRPG